MARRFQFRLETVLRLREREEDEAKKNLAIANQAVQQAEQRITRLREDRAASQAEVRAAYAQPGGFQLVVEQYRYINTLDVQTSRETNILQRLEAEREEKRQAFVEARKRRRALERLREKQAETHRQAMEREMQKELDEMAVRRHGREPEEI